MAGRALTFGALLTILIFIAAPCEADFMIGQNFLGINEAEADNAPPDVASAAGPNQLMAMANGFVTVFDKTGNRIAGSSMSLNSFWSNAGVTLQTLPFDPRVIYDASSGHWFATSADFQVGQLNHFLVAVSKTSDPTQGWTGFQINSWSNPADPRWADFPTIGVNSNGVFMAGNMFHTVNGQQTSDSVNLLVLPKTDLINGSVANATLLNNISGGSAGFTLQPALSYDNNGLPHPVLSDSGNNLSTLKVTQITGSITSPSLNTSSSFQSTPLAPTGSPPPVQQLGSTATLNPNGQFFSASVVLRNGNIWAVENVANGTTTALHWVRIDAASGLVKEDGLIASSTVSYFDGSIAVNAKGDIVIGFTASGSTQFAGADVAVGHFDGTTTTMGAPVQVQAGRGVFGAANTVNRWGDYSSTSIDPNDPNQFWTDQEIALADGTWGTSITQIIITPGVPEPASLALLATGGLGLLGARLVRKHTRRAAQA